MRALALTLALLLTACGMTPLERHATVASAAAGYIDAAGGQLDARKLDDLVSVREHAAGESAYIVERLEEALSNRWLPADKAYRAAVAALLAYETAITDAVARGDSNLGASPVAALVAAWRALADVAGELGVAIPQPVPALEALAKESP